VGADLAYIFCTPSASPVIKSYTPETIVLPILPELPLPDPLNPRTLPDPLPKPLEHFAMVQEWLKKSRMGCLVIGPGLGDDPLVVETAKVAVEEAKRMGLHLVIDGSGLNFIAKVRGRGGWVGMGGGWHCCTAHLIGTEGLYCLRRQ
jgi:ATP-dependent NAD(P)H-hydrate dehydratase